MLAGGSGGASRRRHRVGRVFRTEGHPLLGRAYARNARFATPRTPAHYQTPLDPAHELMFRAWLNRYRIPFDPNARRVDYDMRGYFLHSGGAPHPAGAHFPDTFKTPFDTTFSRESRYATRRNPYVWDGNRLIDRRSGKVMAVSR